MDSACPSDHASEPSRQRDADAQDEWFRSQVQAAIVDSRPSIADGQVRKQFEDRRKELLAAIKRE